MELQHCIACSGVAIASQSKAYAASNTAMIGNKMTFANRIETKLFALSDGVKADGFSPPGHREPLQDCHFACPERSRREWSRPTFSSAPQKYKSNRDGIGARIAVKAGARTLVDEMRSGSSYILNNDMRMHFGLGTTTKIESVQVRWSSGLLERFENLAVDAIHTLREGTGAPVPSSH